MTRIPGFAAPLIVMLFMMPVIANGASKSGKFGARDAGRATCERYVAARSERAALYGLFLGWIAGYITAYNSLAEDTLDIAPWQNTELLAGLLNNHCKKNPQISFGRAVNTLVSSLKATRLQGGPENVEAKSGGRSITVYRAIMRRAQQRLAERGYYEGAIDGLYGKRSRDAFEAFQSGKGIAVTGLPDQETLFHLFR